MLFTTKPWKYKEKLEMTQCLQGRLDTCAHIAGQLVNFRL